MERPGIAVLDFGSQYTQTIARRFRQLKTFSEIFEPKEVYSGDLRNALGIVLSGGPSSVYDEDAPVCNDVIFDLEKPILGICYGFQYMAQHFHGKVERRKKGEYGKAVLEVKTSEEILDGLGPQEQVWMSHADTVTKLPVGWKKLASTEDCENAAAVSPYGTMIGVQYHPEVDHTKNGMRMLDNFLKLCGATEYDWSMEAYLEEAKNKIREEIRGRKVCHLTSGGGDSTVAAIMLQEALEPGQVEFVYMDPGIMRKGETERVEKILRSVGIEPTILHTEKELMKDLEGVTHPEEKRKIIGAHFVKMAKKHWEGKKDGEEWMLGQGTIYPDHIESKGTLHSAKIKTHHNRVIEILDLIGEKRVIEPNLYLFKDELRELAKVIARSNSKYENLELIFAKRHPLPGPGLGIRMICTEKVESIDEMAKKYGLDGATKLLIKTVGVQGDERTLREPALVYGDFPGWDELEKLSIEITNSFRGEINRTIYLWEPKEVESTTVHESYVTKERLDRLREADHIVMSILEETGWMDKMGQCPTIDTGVGLNGSEKNMCVIRPVKTKDYMTASFSKPPPEILDEIAEKLLETGEWCGVAIDVTNKPPGTIEWE